MRKEYFYKRPLLQRIPEPRHDRLSELLQLLLDAVDGYWSEERQRYERVPDEGPGFEDLTDWLMIHSRKFENYCDAVVADELEDLLSEQAASMPIVNMIDLVQTRLAEFQALKSTNQSGEAQ